MTRAVAFSLALLLLSPLTTYGQGTPVPDRRAAVIANVVNEARLAFKEKVARPFADRINVGARQHVGAYLMAVNGQKVAYAKLLKALEVARTDKQIGAPPTASGGTSLAMKGLAPKIFGLAVERGALTREVSGTTLTFRVNPVGVVKALQGAGLAELNDAYFQSAVQRFSQRFSAAATFDVSRGSEPGVFTASDQQLSSWAARYTIIDHRDPASPEYAEEWRKLLPDTNYQASVESFNDALGRWIAYKAWEAELNMTVEKVVEPLAAKGDIDGAAKEYTTQLTNAFKKLESLPLTPDVTIALDAYVTELTRVQGQIDDIYRLVGKGPLLTFDLTDKRDVGLPDLYTATGVFEAGLGQSRKTDFTFNGSVSFFTSKPTGIDHSLKSMNFTAEIEHPLGKALPAPTLTFAARYSFVPNDTLSTTVAARPTTTPEASAVAPVPKGHVVFFQGKLTVPIKDSGAKVPISVTASNRSELIKEKDVRGSIGITLDLDTLTSFLTGRP